MLKRWTILTVFGALATIGLLKGQTALLSTPKEGITKPNGGENGKAQPTAQDGKQATPDSVPSTRQPTTPNCDEACQQGHQNLAIQGKLELFTGVLAVVGVLQVLTMIWQAGLLRGTLVQIRTQANHMEMQNRNATSKERARLSVQHQSNAPAIIDGLRVVDIEGGVIVELNLYVNVMNHGGTKACSVKASGDIYAADGKSPDNRRQWEIPDVIDIDKGISLSPGGPCFIKQMDWKGVENGTHPLHVVGSILYKDIFGDPHETLFHFSWEVQNQGSWGMEGHWVTHTTTST
jgi:hypothetical protein